MTVHLDKDVEDFLLQQVTSGRVENVAELANDLLRSFAQVSPFSLTPEMESQLAEVANEPVTPFDFAEIKEVRDEVFRI